MVRGNKGRKPPRRGGAPAAPPPAGDRPLALVVTLLLGGVYGATLAPTIHAGDTAELATAALSWGIPHPPGYPLFTLLGGLWARALPLGDPALRLNLLAALFSALAGGCLTALLRRWQVPRGAAALAGLTLGLGATVWSQATVYEVYTLDLFLAAAALLAATALRRRPATATAALLGLLLGCWQVHRPLNLTLLPAPLWLAWPGLRALWAGGPRRLLLPLGALAAPGLTLLYLPLASAQDPLLDTGDPETWSRFVEVVTARVYRIYLFSRGPGQNLGEVLAELPRQLGLGLVLAPVGAVATWRSERRPLLLAAAALLLANLAFLAVYGVPDRAVFSLPSLLALALLAGLGATAVMGQARRVGEGRALRLGTSGVLLLAVLLPLFALNGAEANRRGQTLARDFARDALTLPGKRGIVLSQVDTVTFSLYYAQAVEERRPDLLLLSQGRAVEWHQRQARRLRPELELPLYHGPDPAHAWPALVVRRNVAQVPVYVTTTLAGYFGPRAPELARAVEELPAGLLTRLVPRGAAPEAAEVIRQNRAFWGRAWPHAEAARVQALDPDLTALLLHYASMRLLFARYCMVQGRAALARAEAAAVVALDTGPLIARVNRVFARIKARYHLSQMPRMAAELVELAGAVERGQLKPEQLPPALGGRGRAPVQPAPAAPAPAEAGEDPLERLNMEGIARAQAGELSAALARFDAVLKQRPAHRGALFNRAKVLALLGRRTEAEAAYRALLGHEPTHLPGLAGLAELLRGRHPEQARKLYRRALAAPGPAALKAEVQRRLQSLPQAR